MAGANLQAQCQPKRFLICKGGCHKHGGSCPDSLLAGQLKLWHNTLYKASKLLLKLLQLLQDLLGCLIWLFWHGRIATTLGAADVDGLAARHITATNIMGNPTSEKLAALAAQVAAGTLRVEIQGVYPLADAGSAFGAFMSATRGKLVLTNG